jgi:hypothetical protein
MIEAVLSCQALQHGVHVHRDTDLRILLAVRLKGPAGWREEYWCPDCIDDFRRIG